MTHPQLALEFGTVDGGLLVDGVLATLLLWLPLLPLLLVLAGVWLVAEWLRRQLEPRGLSRPESRRQAPSDGRVARWASPAWARP